MSLSNTKGNSIKMRLPLSQRWRVCYPWEVLAVTTRVYGVRLGLARRWNHRAFGFWMENQMCFMGGIQLAQFGLGPFKISKWKTSAFIFEKPKAFSSINIEPPQKKNSSLLFISSLHNYYFYLIEPIIGPVIMGLVGASPSRSGPGLPKFAACRGSSHFLVG